jgi:hypothetical protein
MTDDMKELKATMQEVATYLRLQHHEKQLEKYPRTLKAELRKMLMLPHAETRRQRLDTIVDSLKGSPLLSLSQNKN